MRTWDHNSGNIPWKVLTIRCNLKCQKGQTFAAIDLLLTWINIVSRKKMEIKFYFVLFFTWIRFKAQIVAPLRAALWRGVCPKLSLWFSWVLRSFPCSVIASHSKPTTDIGSVMLYSSCLRKQGGPEMSKVKFLCSFPHYRRVCWVFHKKVNDKADPLNTFTRTKDFCWPSIIKEINCVEVKI